MKPAHSLCLRGHLMGVVDKEQWSAGKASAIAEVALAKLPVKSFCNGLGFSCHGHKAFHYVSKLK